MPSHPPLFHTLKPRPKVSVPVAAVICPLALMVSVYGFWLWSNLLLQQSSSQTEFFYLFALIVYPLAVFAIATFIAAQRLEYDKFYISFQSRIEQLQKRLNAEEELLSSLTDNNPEAVVIFDKNNHFWFANASAAKLLGARDTKEVVGMPSGAYAQIDAVFKLTSRISEARLTKQPMEALHQLAQPPDQVRFLQTYYEPVKLLSGIEGGVMVRWQDVTTLIVQRERNENMMRQLIATLVAMVDRRDPYAAGHSERVGFLSRVIAEEMLLPERDIEAAAIAGSLMNFGKILVPRSMLTKRGNLTPEELQLVREAMLSSADILSMIDFSFPVVPALKQTQEHYDGSGTPHGLAGDQILVTARILAVANTYVALVSTRAHRPGLSSEDALQALLRDADRIFDRHVVSALGNYLHNRRNKPEWLTHTRSA